MTDAIQAIMQIISTIGFPIAVAVWYMAIGHKDSQEHLKALNEMRKTIENNSNIIERFIHMDCGRSIYYKDNKGE